MYDANDIYPDKLRKIIKNKIPRLLRDNESIVLLHTYYSNSLGDFKVMSIEKINGDFYYLIYQYDNMSSMICEPIRGLYELIPNYNDFHTFKIINSYKSYPGYKIKYWFWKNQSKEYEGFYRFLVGMYRINDNKFYTVNGSYENGIWKDCYIREKRR